MVPFQQSKVYYLCNLLTLACMLQISSAYKTTMMIRHSGPGISDPDHCDDLFNVNGVHVTVDYLYELEIENCMDIATNGLYSGEILEPIGPSRRELFEESSNIKEPLSLKAIEEQRERELQTCGSCDGLPCPHCILCCYTCVQYNKCFSNHCPSGSECTNPEDRRLEEDIKADAARAEFEEEMRRLPALTVTSTSGLSITTSIATECTTRVQALTQDLNEIGNYCMGNYVDIEVVPMIYEAAVVTISSFSSTSP